MQVWERIICRFGPYKGEIYVRVTEKQAVFSLCLG